MTSIDEEERQERDLEEEYNRGCSFGVIITLVTFGTLWLIFWIFVKK